MSLGENIYRLRAEGNMSQGDLADALEVSRQSVSKWENNSTTPELDKLIKMSQLFGVTLDRLVGMEEPLPPAPEPPSPAAAARQTMPVHRILGIILLCFGLAALLLLTALSGFFSAFVCSASLITVGIICTVCSDNLPFRCSWGIFAVYSPVACLLLLSMVRPMALVFLGVLWVLLAFLIIWTLAGIRKDRISKSAKRMAVGCMLYIFITALIIGISYSALSDRPVRDTMVEVEASAIPIE